MRCSIAHCLISKPEMSHMVVEFQIHLLWVKVVEIELFYVGFAEVDSKLGKTRAWQRVVSFPLKIESMLGFLWKSNSHVVVAILRSFLSTWTSSVKLPHSFWRELLNVNYNHNLTSSCKLLCHTTQISNKFVVFIANWYLSREIKCNRFNNSF